MRIHLRARGKLEEGCATNWASSHQEEGEARVRDPSARPRRLEESRGKERARRLLLFQPPPCFGLYVHHEHGLCHVAAPFAPSPSLLMLDCLERSRLSFPKPPSSAKRSQRRHPFLPSLISYARCQYGIRSWYEQINHRNY